MMEAYHSCDLHMHVRNAEIGCYVLVIKVCTNGTILPICEGIYLETKDNPQIMTDRIGQCKEIFDKAILSHSPNIGIWNALIHALGRNGDTLNTLVLLLSTAQGAGRPQFIVIL